MHNALVWQGWVMYASDLPKRVGGHAAIAQ
jgi:hypothetical protein